MLERLCTRIERIEEMGLYILLIIVVVALFLQVANRFVMQISLTWTMETATYSLFWMVMIGVSIGVRRRSHLVVDFLIARIPLSIRKYYVSMVYLAMILLLIVFFYQGIIFSFKDGMRVIAPTIGIRMVYVYISIPITSAISILFVIENLILPNRESQ